VAGLTINNAGLAGLVRDVDAGVTRGTSSHDALCTDYVWRSLRRDPRADLRRDLMVLPRLWAFGAEREELFVLCLVKFHNKRFDHSSHASDVILRHNLLISRESSPQRSRYLFFDLGKI